MAGLQTNCCSILRLRVLVVHCARTQIEAIRSATADLLLGTQPIMTTIAVHRFGDAKRIQVRLACEGCFLPAVTAWVACFVLRVHRHVLACLQRSLIPATEAQAAGTGSSLQAWYVVTTNHMHGSYGHIRVQWLKISSSQHSFRAE